MAGESFLIKKGQFENITVQNDIIHFKYQTDFSYKLPFYLQSLSVNSKKSVISDFNIYIQWCVKNNAIGIPAEPIVLRTFVSDMCQTKKPSTIRRYLATINALHGLMGLRKATDSIEVSSIMTDIIDNSDSQKQATPFRMKHINSLSRQAGILDTKRLRDMAIIMVGYSTLCRISEISMMNLEDFDFEENVVLLPKIKGRKGMREERHAFLSDTAQYWLNRWITQMKISSGAVFLSITKHGTLRESRMGPKDIAKVISNMGKESGIKNATGHSLRVGGAQDMLSSGVDTHKAMLAGRWTNERTFMRYAEKIKASESGMSALFKIHSQNT